MQSFKEIYSVVMKLNQFFALHFSQTAYTSTTRTPGCVKAMVNNIGWESLQERLYIARMSLQYKIHMHLWTLTSPTYYNKGTVGQEAAEDSSRTELTGLLQLVLPSYNSGMEQCAWRRHCRYFFGRVPGESNQ